VDDIPAGTSIDVLIAADGQYQYVTGAEMTSTGTEGTITLPEPLAFDIPAYYSNFLIKRSTDAWDRPRLEPKFYNKSDPDYYWAKIDDGNKRPDYVNAQQHLHMQWFTDCMFLHSLGSTRSRPIRYAADEAVGINPGNSSYELLPFPPLNRPQGATAAWPDDADAGVWDVTATSNKTSVFGTDPAAGDDWLTPWVVAARNNSVRPLAGGSTTRPEGFLMADSVWGRRPYQSPVSTLHLEANGTVSDEYAYLADDNDFTPERNTDVTTTVAGAQAPADRLTVADATGIAAGDRLHVRFAPKVGAVQMHATTVTGVDGSDVLLLEPFARDLAGGEEVAVFTPAGAKPAWWNDGVS
jgi:hypothetical protein